MQPRRLRFAVGTTLLTASLSAGAVGCEKAGEGSQPPHVNEGPEPEPEPRTNPMLEPEPEPRTNPMPEPEPEPEVVETVNTVAPDQ